MVGLAASPDGATLASASWDHTVRLWGLGGASPRVLDGHQQNVNGVAFTPDGRAVVSAGYDLTLRIWPLAGGAPTITTLPTPLNGVAVAPDGEIVTGGADGKIYFLSPAGELRGEVAASETPIIAIALSRDGALVAAAGIRGSVAIIERRARRVARTLVGPGLPVWSATFLPDNRTLLTGGADRIIRRWDASSGDQIGSLAVGGADDTLAPYAGDRGAEVFRACVACHTLHAGDTNRAGPTLAGIFGRRIATLAGLPVFRGAQAARHRVDAGDGGEAVRGRADDLHAGHQDARAEDRRRRGPRRAGEVSGEGDEGMNVVRVVTAHVFALLLPLAQIILARAHLRTRRPP